jgi:uracil-DNA glycosylase
MLATAHPVHSETIASALAWWADAGVDTLVSEAPTPWLARAGKFVAPAPLPEPVAAAKPASLTEVIDRLRALPALDTVAPVGQRLPASGPADADLMAIIDMPEPGDVAAGALISGEAGVLFDKMLAAIGRDRASVYVAALCPARSAGGMVPAALVEELAEYARQHIGFSGAKRVWVMGQTASRALIGADARPGRAEKRNINHNGGNVEAVASFSPRLLLQNAKLKKAAWDDMQALMRGLTA